MTINNLFSQDFGDTQFTNAYMTIVSLVNKHCLIANKDIKRLSVIQYKLKRQNTLDCSFSLSKTLQAYAFEFECRANFSKTKFKSRICMAVCICALWYMITNCLICTVCSVYTHICNGKHVYLNISSLREY